MRTAKTGSITSEGVIPHKWHPAGFYMPVKLRINLSYTVKINDPQPPMRDGAGQLVYALPGGGNAS